MAEGEKPSLSATLRELPRTLALVFSASRGGTFGLAALTLASSGIPVAIAWAGKRIVDAVVVHARDEALRWVVIELALVVAAATARRGLILLRSVLTARLSVDVNAMILEKAVTFTLRDFEDPEIYDQLTRARREASSRPIGVVMQSFGFVESALTLAGYASLLVSYSAWAVLGLALATVPAALVEMKFSGEAFRLRSWRAPETRRLAYLEAVLGVDSYAKEVRALGLGPTLLGWYRELGERLYREDRRLAIRRAASALGLSLLATLAFYGAYASLAIAAALGVIGLGSLTMYVVAFRQGQQAFQSLLSSIAGLYEDGLYMTTLFGLMDRPPSASPPPPPSLAPEKRSGLELRGVGFRYPGKEAWALRDVTIAVPPGESLALVGQNGSGKTTLIKLLLRLVDPTEGVILLDGKDLRSWDEAALRARIAAVFQDFARYQLSLRENVGLGADAHVADDARIERAMAKGGADAVAARLPDGLATPLGRWFHKKGVELSGGEWQRIALARGFAREDADILVLDEPTAALDAEAEAAVFARFRELAKGRTAILVSHRFPTVRGADRIVVLHDGRVVEEGTHESLVAAEGRYARLFALQAEGYR